MGKKRPRSERDEGRTDISVDVTANRCCQQCVRYRSFVQGAPSTRTDIVKLNVGGVHYTTTKETLIHASEYFSRLLDVEAFSSPLDEEGCVTPLSLINIRT